MSENKNTHKSKTTMLYEDAEFLFEVFDFNDLESEVITLLKTKVHFLFCLNADINFQFSPSYNRNLKKENSFIIHNPDMDLNAMLSSANMGILIRLSIKIQKLHQLFSPDAHSAPVFNPANLKLKSYEEIELIPGIIIVLNNILNKGKLKDANRLFFQAKILEIFSLIYSEQPPASDNCPFLKNEITIKKIKEVKEIIIANYQNPPTIRELAKAVQLNEQQLKVGFKEMYGSGPYHYVMAHKLEIAKQLLLSGELLVHEVAHQIGYSNTSHFIDAFKKQFGVTPKKLMK
jgi:AraC-like DNA-binding protein